jgi:hypothetical protein
VEKSGGSGPSKCANRYHQQQKEQPTTLQPRFEGRCDDIKGFVFDCSNGRQADRYNMAMREIAEYVGRTHTYGEYIMWSMENKEKFKNPEPMDLAYNATAIKRRIWEKRVDEYVKRDVKLNKNIKKLYTLVYGQCRGFTRANTESLTDYKTIK